MVERLRAAFQWFLAVFVQREPEAPKRQPSRAKEVEAQGVWYHFGTLLGDLDSYFRLLKYMRKVDPDAYAGFQKIGGVVACRAEHVTYEHGELPAAWRHGHRPTIGMTSMFLNESTAETVNPAFGYYWKFKQPAGVQASVGDIYAVCMLFVEPEEKIPAKPIYFHVSVDGKGRVSLLKERCTWTERPPRSKRRHKGDPESISYLGWAYPSGVMLGWEDHKHQFATAELWAAFIFRILVQGTEQAMDGLLVRVRRGGLVAAFHIDMLRTPYFFKDRELEVNENGRRKRIVHIVRTHERNLSDGRTTFVRSHFRGMRKFNWNGYAVNVTMPGLHHRDLRDLSVAGLPSDELHDDLVGWEEVAESLDQHMGA